MGDRLTQINYRARAGVTADEVAHILLEPSVAGDPRLPTVALRLADNVTLARAEEMAEAFNMGELTAWRHSPEQRLLGSEIPELHLAPGPVPN